MATLAPPCPRALTPSSSQKTFSHFKVEKRLRFQGLAQKPQGGGALSARSCVHTEFLAEEVGIMKELKGEEASASMHPVAEGDIYAGISTIPISVALAGSGVDPSDLNGSACNLLDRPNKKQVRLLFFVVFVFSYVLLQA